MNKKYFRPLPFVFLLVSATLLLFSWSRPGIVRVFWDRADRFVFYTLNGSLNDNPLWQLFWAVANTIYFDIFIGCTIAFLYYRYSARANGSEAIERLCTFFTMITTAVLCKYLARFFPDIKRSSASLNLQPANLLSHEVPWLHTKDISYDSFPSDHGTLLFLSVVFLWFFAGRHEGLKMLAPAFFFCLPRLFSGAHWLSDMAIGSVAVTMIAGALILCTPIHQLVLRSFIAVFNRPLFISALSFTGFKK